MKRHALAAAVFACGALAATPAADAGMFDSNGYPGSGRAIDQLKPAGSYADLLKTRPLTLGIMRTRGQGFVPSPALREYVRSIMLRLLAGVTLPPTFQPDIRVLAAPTFAGECTPDGTMILTVGLLEQLETEDELAFVIGHELSHAIYRHQQADWYKKAQYYAVINGAAVDTVAFSAAAVAGRSLGGNIMRGLDVAQHLAKLSSNVLQPQMERGQEDQADALGFDMMVKAGYDPEAAFAVMDKLAIQEAESARAAQAAKASEGKKSDDSGGGGLLGGVGAVGGMLGSLAMGGRPSNDQIADVAIFAFDSAVDNMAADATTHHPATEREELLSGYIYRSYRDLPPASATPLPWAAQSSSPLKPPLTALLSHYAKAEDAAAYVADPRSSTPAMALGNVSIATAPPTADHAYTEYAAAEVYDQQREPQRSEAALREAVAGQEPSWEIYSKLINLDMARGDYTGAQALMDKAVVQFEDSPVLLPKRIQILHALGRQADAAALLPKCKSYDIDELSDACKKAEEG